MTQTDMTPLQRLAKVLQLGTPSNYRNHTYINSESLYFPTGRVYGGQVIAQSLMAASRTVAPSRLPNSIHGYFISAGDIRQDLLFDVENLRDGRSFSARRVNVTQAQGSILTAIASFQEHDQEGIEFADPMPENIPGPDSLTSAKQLMEPYAEQSPFAKYYAEKSPFDIRHVTRTIMLGADKKSASEDSGKQMVWMKADGKVDVPQVMHRAMLAMGCDQIMLEPILRRAGLSIATPGISYASIDHSMWWYRDIDINQWHLYVQDTPTAAHGRGLGQAKVYTQDGELVACMAHRDTQAHLSDGATLIIKEKIMTHGHQHAETNFSVDLDGYDSSTNVISRSVAKDHSSQMFNSNIRGNNKCAGHSECDAIIMDEGIVGARPEITANSVEASLIHEAAIGKIAGEQLNKLMTLGLTEKEAEEQIISGFLK